MSLTLSIVAILISLASFGFGLYQYRNSRKVSLLEKSNTALKHAYEVRKSVQDLRHKIDVTDDIDDHEKELNMLSSATEKLFTHVLDSKSITLEEAYMAEKAIIKIDLEFSLLSKQIDASIAFNEELKSIGSQPLTRAGT